MARALQSYTELGLHPLNTGQIRGWGGARNRADRVSYRLMRWQAEKLILAAQMAEVNGLAFNRHWTVHYERAGIDDRDGAAFVAKLIHLARQQVRREGGTLAAIWVRENGDGKGAHVHILLHLPAGMSLRGRTSRWIKCAGGTIRARVSKVRTIGASLGSAATGSDHYWENADKVLAYVLKYTDAESGQALRLDRYGESGMVLGKRCGCTLNLRPEP